MRVDQIRLSVKRIISAEQIIGRYFPAVPFSDNPFFEGPGPDDTRPPGDRYANASSPHDELAPVRQHQAEGDLAGMVDRERVEREFGQQAVDEPREPTKAR